MCNLSNQDTVKHNKQETDEVVTYAFCNNTTSSIIRIGFSDVSFNTALSSRCHYKFFSRALSSIVAQLGESWKQHQLISGLCQQQCVMYICSSMTIHTWNMQSTYVDTHCEADATSLPPGAQARKTTRRLAAACTYCSIVKDVQS